MFNGNDAFSGCSGLTTITIPAGLKAIGTNVFPGKVVLVFEDVLKLDAWPSDFNKNSQADIEIPDVTAISSGAFAGCTGLTSVEIPDSLTSIGSRAFSGCPALYPDEDGVQYESSEKRVLVAAPALLTGEFAMPKTVRFIHSEAFVGCTAVTLVEFPESVIQIGEKAFFNCSGLTTLVFPETSKLTTIADEAFFGCTGLVEIYPLNLTGENTLPGNLETIGAKAFANCVSLREFTIPNQVSTLAASTFAGCKALTSITIHEGVDIVGTDAFADCADLEGVYISDLADWCEIDFGNPKANPLYYANNLYVEDELVTELDIPDTTTSISAYAFYNATALTTVTIPSTVGRIGTSAFTGCTNLTLVKFLGVPPPYVGTFSIFPQGQQIQGYYLGESTIAPAWEEVIVNGQWKNLTMLELPTAILTNQALLDWLKPTLGTMAGTIVIDEDTAVYDAFLLGVSPELVDVLGDAAVTVETNFDVSSITVADDKIAIVVTVTVPVGSVPKDVTLNGEVKVWYKDNLADTKWSEITIKKLTVEEVDDECYTISIDIPFGTHKFYQVTVE